MKLEYVVIAGQHPAVNMPLLLAHTARQTGLTGGVCKEQGHIHRGMLTRDYYVFQLHEGELQPSIRITSRFQDCLHLSVSKPIVLPFVARV